MLQLRQKPKPQPFQQNISRLSQSASRLLPKSTRKRKLRHVMSRINSLKKQGARVTDVKGTALTKRLQEFPGGQGRHAGTIPRNLCPFLSQFSVCPFSVLLFVPSIFSPVSPSPRQTVPVSTGPVTSLYLETRVPHGHNTCSAKGTTWFRNFSIDNDLFTTMFTVQMGRGNLDTWIDCSWL